MRQGIYRTICGSWQLAKENGFWLKPYLSLEMREVIAEKLNRLLWVPTLMVVGLTQLALLVTVGFREPTRFIPGMYWVVALLTARWVAKRRGALSGLKFVILGLVGATSFAVLAHSVHAPAFWGNILALAVIVPLYGARAGVLLSLWCALCGATWFFLYRHGWTVGLVYPPSLFAFTFLMGCMLSGIGLMSIPTALLASALRSAQNRQLEAESARRAEQNAELALKAVFEQTGALTALIEPDGVILRLNPMAERLLGIDAAQFVGKSINELPWANADVKAQLAYAILRAAEGIERLDVVVQGAAGPRHLQLAIAPIFGLDGQLRSLVVEGLDATRLLEAERDLAHARRLESLGQLAGGVAHDFNNMLLAMQGALESLQSRKLGPTEQAESLQTLSQAVHRAADLTRKLLAFGRRDRFENQLVDLEVLITEATNIFRRTLGAPIEVVLELDTERTLIDGDAAAIEHALVNLMVNARDAMKHGGTITLKTKVRHVDEQFCQRQSFPISSGKFVELSVTDEGVGMSEEVRARAFEPFFTTKAIGEGSGLGLAAVHGTMLSHGGGVSVESKLEVGTTVHLYFPAAIRQISSRVPASGVGYSVQLTGTVLVIDDEPLVLRVTRRYLRSLGVTCELASDGQTALSFLDSGKVFDCVLTDIVMPKMSGIVLISEIRQRCPDLPVVVMSGFPAGTEGLAQETLTEYPWLRKPFGSPELAKVLGPILCEMREKRLSS
jgi:PAS domain S-box-containing protein